MIDSKHTPPFGHPFPKGERAGAAFFNWELKNWELRIRLARPFVLSVHSSQVTVHRSQITIHWSLFVGRQPPPSCACCAETKHFIFSFFHFAELWVVQKHSISFFHFFILQKWAFYILLLVNWLFQNMLCGWICILEALDRCNCRMGVMGYGLWLMGCRWRVWPCVTDRCPSSWQSGLGKKYMMMKNEMKMNW